MEIAKRSKTPLEMIKEQNMLLKQFGEKGLVVYRLIGTETTVGELLDATGLDEKELMKILEFMEANNIIDMRAEEPSEYGRAAYGGRETPAVGGRRPTRPISMIKKETEETAEEVEEEEGEEVEEREEGPEAGEIGEEETPKDGETGKGEGEGVGEEEEAEEEKPAEPFGETEETAEEVEEEKETGEKEEEGEEEVEKEEVEEKEEEPETEETKGEIGEETEEEEGATAPGEPSKPSETQAPLSPVERMIFDKFGDAGIKVYNMIDGERTAEEILRETGMSEAKLVEVLEFLDSKGIIRLERPGEQKPKISEIAPITETAEEEVPMEAKKEEIIPIDVASKTRLGMLDVAKLKFELRFKLGPKAVKIYEQINGVRDIIDLATENCVSIYFVDAVMEFLADRNAAVFKTLKREDIVNKYGDEGLTIYKKYGREGVYIYELIGRVPSFRELVSISGMNPERVIDIFLYIHRVLNIDLPVSREMLYKELEL